MVTAVVWSTAYSQKPNVLILLVDDLGYGDLGYTGIPAHFVAQFNVF
jgi:arylsulfatase A-like enzyme